MSKKCSSDILDDLESNIKLLCDQANNHMKVRDYNRALIGYNKALDLNVNDVNALISRSKCLLLLGEPIKALQDSENALLVDNHNIRAIYQKAESLYFLGQFEQSLIFFHRGLKTRPELTSFRLGVQKTQQAIENTIGFHFHCKKMNKTNTEISNLSNVTSKPPHLKANKKQNERITKKPINRKLLGELCVDQEYLEKLFKHPDIQTAGINTKNILDLAKDGAEFLNKRQEFWRQQRTCTALNNIKITNSDNIPPWF